MLQPGGGGVVGFGVVGFGVVGFEVVGVGVAVGLGVRVGVWVVEPDGRVVVGAAVERLAVVVGVDGRGAVEDVRADVGPGVLVCDELVMDELVALAGLEPGVPRCAHPEETSRVNAAAAAKPATALLMVPPCPAILRAD